MQIRNIGRWYSMLMGISARSFSCFAFVLVYLLQQTLVVWWTVDYAVCKLWGS
jgi:hypothetical protein